jgi:hypothetical protein
MTIARPAANRFGLLLISILVVGCISTKGCGDRWSPMVRIYNRTLTEVSFGGEWAPPCDMAIFDRASWPSPDPRRMPPPAGSVTFSADLGVPPSYQGDVTIIVSRAGVEIVQGIIDQDQLPRCAGVPPSSEPVNSPAGSAR